MQHIYSIDDISVSFPNCTNDVDLIRVDEGYISTLSCLAGMMENTLISTLATAQRLLHKEGTLSLVEVAALCGDTDFAELLRMQPSRVHRPDALLVHLEGLEQAGVIVKPAHVQGLDPSDFQTAA